MKMERKMDENDRVRAVREAISTECGHDVRVLAERLRRRQEEAERRGRKVIRVQKGKRIGSKVPVVAEDRAEYGG